MLHLYAHKSDGDPHDEIVHLEAHIEELAAKIESCCKFILASRIAIAGGGIVLAAMFLGAIRFDPAAMAAAVAALLGGIVVWGSNGSTAKEAAKELAAAEADRAAPIARQSATQDAIDNQRPPSSIPFGLIAMDQSHGDRSFRAALTGGGSPPGQQHQRRGPEIPIWQCRDRLS